MYLRDLAVGATWITNTAERVAFNVTTLCVNLELLRALPRRKIVLDNLAKLNVFVGEQGPDGVDYYKWQGIGNVYVPDFSFYEYFALARTEQQQAILRLYQSVIFLVADRTGSDATLCYSTIDKVRSLGLPLPDISVQEYLSAFRRGAAKAHA